MSAFSVYVTSFLVLFLISSGSLNSLSIQDKFDKFVANYKKKHEGGLKIIGGDEAKPGELFWQVSLQYYFYLSDKPEEGEMTHFCGASIINENWILTAAHCMAEPEELPEEVKYDMWVVAGEYDKTKTDGIEQPTRVVKKISHRDYDSETMMNDIALLKVEESLNYTDEIFKINLPFTREASVGYSCKISGWGATTYNPNTGSDDYPDILMESEVPIITDELCEETCKKVKDANSELNNYDCTIQREKMCGGVPQGGKDTCQGDSGGPVICQREDGALYQAGVVSYGAGCGLPGLYGVYTEVSYYVDWINRVIETEEDEPDGGGAASLAVAPLLILICYILNFRLN